MSTAARAEKVCCYDLDDIDASWLGCANSDRGMQTLPVISEFLMEQVIEELELQCWEQVQTILKSQEGLGIEYDENVICDVCRSVIFYKLFLFNCYILDYILDYDGQRIINLIMNILIIILARVRRRERDGVLRLL